MSFFLRHSIGFFLQIFPCVFLCFLPFSKESYRLSSKRVQIGGGCLAVFISALFPLLLRLSPSISPNVYALANLYMLAAILLFVISFFLIIAEPLMKKILIVTLVIFYATTQYLTVNILTLLFLEQEYAYTEIYFPVAFWLFIATTAVMFPIAARFIGTVVRDFIREIEPKNMKKDFLCVLFASFLYFILMFSYTSLSDVGFLSHWWTLGPAFLFALLVLAIFYWSLFRSSLRLQKEGEYRQQLEIQKVQYQKIIQDMENVRRMRHDMRHHLLGLYTMAEQEDSPLIRKYLSDVIEQTNKTEIEWFCENITVNGLLQYYIGQAREAGISCDVTASCEDLPAAPEDLTVILGNALENAVASCRKSQGKRLSVKIGTVSGSLAVLIDNSCDSVKLSARYRSDDSFFPAEAFGSLKPNGGYGLKSISVTAQKYGGDADFKFDEPEKTFTTRIRMNLKEHQ